MTPPRSLAALLLPLLLCLPAWSQGQFVGSPGGELFGHAWTQWLAAQSWPALPQVEAWTTAGDRPAIDPLQTWIAGALLPRIGAPHAWNLLTLIGLWLAGIGGARLAEAVARRSADREAPDPAPDTPDPARLAGWFGMAAAQTSPIFLGSITSGLTEDLGWGLAMIALADLISADTANAAAPPRRLRGAILLGLCAATGLYTAWMGGLAAAALGLFEIARAAPAARARAALRWSAAGALALALALAISAPHLSRILAARAQPQAGPGPMTEPLWRLNPWQGADLASFLAPGKQPVGDALVREHPAWIGLILPGLALYALISARSRPRRLALLPPLRLAAIWLLLLGAAAGPHPALLGQPLGLPNPAYALLRLLPGAANLHHHARLLLLAQPILLALAIPGLIALSQARPRLTRWLPLAIALDHLILSPARAPLPGTPPASPEIYQALAALPPGPVAVLNASGPGVHPQRVFYDQRAHQRRLLLDPDRPAPLKKIPAGAILVALDRGDPASRDAIAREEARRGPPALRTADGAAWIAE